MSDDFDLASAVFKTRRAEGSRVGETSTVYATAVSDSKGGSVEVFIGDDTVADGEEWDDDGNQVSSGSGVTVELPTSPAVKEGDEVIVTLVGGAAKTPIVTGNIGSGDVIVDSMQEAIRVTEEAKEVIEATGQHFFSDDNGVHVTEVANDPDTEHNILVNSLGILLRKAKNALVSITNSAIAFFDGEGMEESNVVARFGKDGATIGAESKPQLKLTSSQLSFENESDSSVFGISLGRNVTISKERTLDNYTTLSEVEVKSSYQFSDSGAVSAPDAKHHEILYVKGNDADNRVYGIAVGSTSGGNESLYTVSIEQGTGVTVTLTDEGVAAVEGAFAELQLAWKDVTKYYRILLHYFVKAPYSSVLSMTGLAEFVGDVEIHPTPSSSELESDAFATIYNSFGVGYKFGTTSAEGGIWTPESVGMITNNTYQTIIDAENSIQLMKPTTVIGSLTVTGSADVGTLSTGGPVTLGIASGDAAAEIKAKLGSNLFSVLRAYPGNDQYGAGVYLGAGGRTVIGGGEYSTALKEQQDGNDSEEQLYLGSDNDVYVETNANTFANRRRWTFGKDGTLTAPGGVTASAKDSSYLTGATAGYPAIYVKKANASGWCPVFATPTAGGGAWELANHNDEDLVFAYLAKSRLDAKNNGFDRKVTLNPEQKGVFWSNGSDARFRPAMVALKTGISVTNGASITIPNLDKYNVFMFEIDMTNKASGDVGWPCIAVKSQREGTWTAFCVHDTGEGTVIDAGQGTYSGTTLKVTAVSQHCYDSGVAYAKQGYLHAVYGIL